MRVLLALVAFLSLCAISARAHDLDQRDIPDVANAMALYGTKVNALAKFSPKVCGGTPAPGLAAAARDLIDTTFSKKYLRYYRTAGPDPLNFTLGGNFSLLGPIVPLTNRSVFFDQLAGFYSFIFSLIFSQPNHWLYSMPRVSFTRNDPAFDRADTAIVEVENESRAFVCSVDGSNTRKFQVFFNTFKHVLCFEDLPGIQNDGWKICGFFEDNKGIFTQPASAFTQLFP